MSTSLAYYSRERTGGIQRTKVPHSNLILIPYRPWPLELTPPVIYRNADTSRSYTYADVKQAAISFGAGLKAMWDWQKGDILALFTPNCIDTPAVIWGCLWAGGILSPANPGYMPDELAFQLDDAGAKALVTQRHLLPIAQQAARRVGIPDDRIILLGDERDPSIRFKHFTSIRNIAGTSRYRRTRLNPEKDLAFLVYSSGTTGYPKGVMLSHGNIVANILMLSVGEGNHLTWNDGESGTGDNVLAVLPFFHIYGTSWYYGVLGTLTSLMPSFRPFVHIASSSLPRINRHRHAKV